MAIKRRGARKAADKKIADVIEKGIGLNDGHKLFTDLSKVAGNKFRERMARVKRVIEERRTGLI
jgi:hypothetical protein